MVGAKEVLAAVLLLILGLFSVSSSFLPHLQSRLYRCTVLQSPAGWLGKAVLTGWWSLWRLETLPWRWTCAWEGVGTPADALRWRSKSLSAVLKGAAAQSKGCVSWWWGNPCHGPNSSEKNASVRGLECIQMEVKPHTWSHVDETVQLLWNSNPAQTLD